MKARLLVICYFLFRCPDMDISENGLIPLSIMISLKDHYHFKSPLSLLIPIKMFWKMSLLVAISISSEKGDFLDICNQVRCIMAEVDELNRQIQIREMRREKLEVNLVLIDAIIIVIFTTLNVR